MDDLLSAALSESGLDEFLKPESVEETRTPGHVSVPSTSTADVSLLCHDYGTSKPAPIASRLIRPAYTSLPTPPKPAAVPSPSATASPKYILVMGGDKGRSSATRLIRTAPRLANPAMRIHSAVPASASPNRQTIRIAAGGGSLTRPGSGAVLVGTGRPGTFVRSATSPGGVYVTQGTPRPLGTQTRFVRRPLAGIVRTGDELRPLSAFTLPSPGLNRPPPPAARRPLGVQPYRIGDSPQAPELQTRTLLSVGPKRGTDAAASQAPPAKKVKSEGERKTPTPPPRAEEEDLGHAETYADYRPAKLRSGIPHPDTVVETSSLASVPPPEIRYHVAIPEEVIDEGRLSALQLEAVIYASQQHQYRLPSGERCGYLVGDGAGVGKGRTVAAIIYENFLLGRKRALWFSISADLKYDAERDLSDIGATKIKVYALNKMRYCRISAKENDSVKKGVIFATYSSLIGESHGPEGKSKYKSRLKQLIHWCGKDFDGAIIFDECHRAKNLVPIGGQKPTKTGAAVLELQKCLPNARIVYASATGATEPRNMAYMTRLGLWGPGRAFPDFLDFINSVERRGVGAMELVAMDLKQRGLYLARQLSFDGVSFRIEEVPLSREFIAVYDRAARLWMEARQKFAWAAAVVDGGRGEKKTMWAQFWAAHQRFFKYLCIASKVRACVKVAREAVKNGKSVVIGLQSTGEAKTLEQIEELGEHLNDFVSTAKAVLQSVVERHFPSGSGDEATFGSLSSDFFSREPNFNSSTSTRKPKVELWEGSSGSEASSSGESDSGTSSADEEDGEDWLKSLLEEEAKSSEEEEEDDDDDEEEEKADKAQHSDPEDFNPFADDADHSDLWADQQQIVEEASMPEEEKPSKKKRRKKKGKKSAVSALKRKEGATTAVGSNAGYSAEEFLSTARSVESSRTDVADGGEFSVSRVQLMKAELLAEVERLGELLPPNTLDQLIAELGGSEAVAEMTGRKGRVVARDDGVAYELRHVNDAPLEILNLTEKNRFMAGQKMIAIISEAASSGISLQADRRVVNQSRRVHITLELPWSADKAIQQFGRTHRSNQVSAPEYLFLISELAGERRFASVVAKRLESLGALTHGDRRATETRDLSQFNLDTKFGRRALEETLKAVLGMMHPPRVPPPTNYPVADFFGDIREYLVGVGLIQRDGDSFAVERDATNLAKFLNRILGLPVHAQNALFQYFSDTLEAVTEEAKKDGRYDLGILDLGTGGSSVDKKETRVYIGSAESGNNRVELFTVAVERGLSWADAHDIYLEHNGEGEGFYQATGVGGLGKVTIVLVVGAGRKRLDTAQRLYNLYRPNTGIHHSLETLESLKARNLRRVGPSEAEAAWRAQFDASLAQCQHRFMFGQCRSGGEDCEVGKRFRSYHVLAGSVLSVWPTVEAVLNETNRKARMQVIRVRTTEGQKIVGVWVPSQALKALHAALAAQAGRHFTHTHQSHD